MDKKTAEKLARKFLSEKIDINVYLKEPPGVSVYPFNPENEFLIGFSLFEEPRFGSSNFLTISKEDGSIRHVGQHGE